MLLLQVFPVGELSIRVDVSIAPSPRTRTTRNVQIFREGILQQRKQLQIQTSESGHAHHSYAHASDETAAH